ncbi:hypothetical protein [Natrarchaeobaculum sulfurireducens]|uniref:Uncharacterized protein n=1 Tax=Natrarchaeobaculum sulfurireducens TaxID=2044521 RepID=A0A346PH57_9EURY|nr:hypothetical protein [Natrarchaeobaculum sulfurireducens]AXR78852.1 hypothetical protein AArc1_2537 [Natrarchaeobaculum sulfurireducens]AXR81102.1 hypothetical protein AArcMg_1086 [Natrarchaeobaculum sulfurireducens]
MLALVIGLGLVALGLAGVRYAPAIVQAQHRQRMTPIDADEINDEDRVRVTKGTAVAVALLGVGLVAYTVV